MLDKTQLLDLINRIINYDDDMVHKVGVSLMIIDGCKVDGELPKDLIQLRKVVFNDTYPDISDYIARMKFGMLYSERVDESGIEHASLDKNQVLDVISKSVRYFWGRHATLPYLIDQLKVDGKLPKSWARLRYLVGKPIGTCHERNIVLDHIKTMKCNDLSGDDMVGCESHIYHGNEGWVLEHDYLWEIV